MRASAHLLLLSALWEAAACVNLRKIEFDILRASRPSLFLFTATGCKECDRIQGLLNEVASGVLRTIPIATINCRDEPEACDESQIFAVPTLKFTTGNGDLVTYKEAVELPAIVRYIERQSGSPVTNLTESDHLDFAASSRVAVIAFLSASASQEDRQAFETVAGKWRTHFSFGSVQGGHDADPFIAVHSRDRDDIMHYRGKFNADDIEAFLRDATTPLVHEFDPIVHQELTKDGKPLAQIFFRQGIDRDKIAKSLAPLAKKFRDQINWVTVRVPDYHDQLERMHLDKDIEQGFAVADALGRAYPMSSPQVNADEVARHIKAYLAGTITPTIKSEVIPEPSEELAFLTTLVGSNFDKIAFDKSRDVLIEFYVPWSEYCQDLLRVMNHLSSKYVEFGLSDKITVAAINVEANDVPIHIDSYPSLKLYRAGTNEVVSFVGDFHQMLTPELLDAFVSSQGKHGVSAFRKDTTDRHEEL